MSPTDGFQKVKDGHFAFFCEESTANRVIENIFVPHEICSLERIPLRRNDLIGYILKKFSPLRERFLINLLWMNEIGIIYKISRHWNGARPPCVSRGHFEGVRFEYLASIFLFLGFAHVLSLIILSVELLMNRYHMKRKTKRVKCVIPMRNRKFRCNFEYKN